jgi:magnesium chelatase accessory protein
MAESRVLVWDRDGRDWPYHECSRFVPVDGIRWHVQQFGAGPLALLVHGTGASTHSWSWLAPLLSDDFSLIAMDLPGHGFTSPVPASAMSLPAISHAVGALLHHLRLEPTIAIGHSAGAAILARMALDQLIAPSTIISINGALTPFSGMAGLIFPAMAKALFLNPLSISFFAWRASRPRAVERLIEGTGSHVPPRSLELYRRLFRSPDHIAAALAMMANWDLAPVFRDLPQLKAKLTQIIGSNDRAIPPDQAFQLAERIPGAEVALLRGVGHLAQEEAPHRVAPLILSAAASLVACESSAS